MTTPGAAAIFDGSIDPDEPTACSYSPDYPCPHELRARVRGTWPTAQTERAAQARGQARAVGQAAEQAEAAPLAHAIGEMLTAALRLTLTAAESAHALDLPHEAKRMESAARALKRAQTPWDGLT